MIIFQCGKRHRWWLEKSEATDCPICKRKSEDTVKKSDEMCPSCGVRGKLWLGVSGLSYCDHCNFEWNTTWKKIDVLQSILDFRKNRSAP